MADAREPPDVTAFGREIARVLFGGRHPRTRCAFVKVFPRRRLRKKAAGLAGWAVIDDIVSTRRSTLGAA